LTEYRKRGVKAYLTGHVPPGKKFYYPSCNRRYTLWSHAFRDVILGHFYGHNNMDHFFFLDAKQAFEEEEDAEMLKRLIDKDDPIDYSTLSPSELDSLSRLSTRSASSLLDSHDVVTLSAEEYLSDLKEMFSSLPEKPKHKKWRKGKKGEKDKEKWEKKVRKYEENYQVVQVAPSIIPAYFSGIRVFEYNVSELAGVQFTRDEYVERVNWTEWWIQMDQEIAQEIELDVPDRKGLTFQQSDELALDDYLSEDNYLNAPRRQREDLPQRKKKKPKKQPPFRLPPGPHKSAPRGPVYESQLFTPLRWEIHFVNLTMTNALYDQDPERSWDYGKDFFRMEYSSSAAPYNMKDLTVGTWLDLGIKIGKDKKVSESTLDGTENVVELVDSFIGDVENDGNSIEKGTKKKGKGKKNKKNLETYWDVFLRRVFIASGHESQLETD
jgi:endopolyphosphatase